MTRKLRRAVGRTPVERRMRIAVAAGVVLYAVGVLLAEAVGGMTEAGLWFGVALVAAGLALGYALGLGRARRAGRTR